jgi:ACS family D-galactonate transporter-like MFS transporter
LKVHSGQTERVTSQASIPGSRTSVRWKIFLMMLTLITINYVDRASLSVAMPLIAREFALQPAMQGLVLSSFFWTYAFMQIPGGLLADHFKPRLVIAVSTAFWGAFQALAAVSTSGAGLVLTRLGLGAAEGPIYPAGGKLNVLWLTPNERGRGATLLDGGAPLGAALGAVIVTWLITVFGSWRMAFLISGLGTVAAGVFSWHYIRNSPREHSAANDDEVRYLEEAHAIEFAREPSNATGRSIDFFKHRSVWAMLLGWMCFNAVFYGLLTWMPSYLSKVHNFNLASMGGASSVIFFSGFIGELVGGWIADKWSGSGASPNLVLRTIFGVAAIVSTVSIFSVSYTTNSRVVIVLLSSTLFFLRWCGIYWSLPSILATRNKVGFLGGVMNLGGNVAGIGVPLLVGLIVQYTGSYFGAFMFFAAAGLGLLLCSLAIDYEKKVAV